MREQGGETFKAPYLTNLIFSETKGGYSMPGSFRRTELSSCIRTSTTSFYSVVSLYSEPHCLQNGPHTSLGRDNVLNIAVFVAHSTVPGTW